MKRAPVICILFISLFMYAPACNQKSAENTNNESVVSTNNENPKNITPEVPFKNQPNEFCTVIRKLDISYYEPKKEIENVSGHPKKYCLLDVCLDEISNNGLIINLGDSMETVTVNYSLIKVFETVDEAKTYADKYGIKDIVYER